MSSTDTPRTTDRPFTWLMALVTTVLTFLVAGIIVLLVRAAVPLSILGTAVVMLGIGARLAMVLGRFAYAVEAVVERVCWLVVALGAICFESLDVRVWVAAIAFTVLLVIDLVDARVSTGQRP